MKALVSVSLLLLPFTFLAQKENTKRDQTLVNIYHLAPDLHLKVDQFTFSIQESYLGTDGNFYEHTVNSPYIGPLQSINAYLKAMGGLTSVRYSDKSDFMTLQQNNIPFIHFEIEASDLQFLSEQEKRPLVRLNDNYNLKLVYFLQASVKLTHVHGDQLTPFADTVISINQRFEKQFPKDYRTPSHGKLTAKSKDSLNILWIQHRQMVKESWRMNAVNDLIAAAVKSYNERCISGAVTHYFRCYTDRNKKGGFDELVKASDLFEATMKTVHKRGSVSNTTELNHFWSADVQKNLASCRTIWKNFLETKTISDNLRSKLTFNYALSSLLLGDFEAFHEVMGNSVPKPFRVIDSVDQGYLLDKMKIIQPEFEMHAKQRNWVRFADL